MRNTTIRFLNIILDDIEVSDYNLTLIRNPKGEIARDLGITPCKPPRVPKVGWCHVSHKVLSIPLRKRQ